MHREGLSFIKCMLPMEQDRPDVTRRRDRWKRHQKRIDPKRLAFVDERGRRPTWPRSGAEPSWPSLAYLEDCIEDAAVTGVRRRFDSIYAIG